MMRVSLDSEAMSEQHDFNNTVVAVLGARPDADDAVGALSAAGYGLEVLVGDEGRGHIAPDWGDDLTGKIKSMLTAFGDQKRIIKRLDEALQQGKVVVSVDIGDREPAEAASILQDHGGEYIWRLGEWTFSPIET